MNALTEKDAATAYAKAWNNLDHTDFVELLAEDAHYSSQYVLDELKGKEAISEYLKGKFNAVRSSGSKVVADIAVIQKPYPEKYCTILVQDGDAPVIIFKVHEGKIQRYDLCMPELFSVQHTDKFPK